MVSPRLNLLRNWLCNLMNEMGPLLNTVIKLFNKQVYSLGTVCAAQNKVFR